MFLFFQKLMPGHLLSCLTGWLASKELGWLTHVGIKTFIKRYDVNMTEAKRPDPKAYPTFNHFFTRHLKEGARSFDLTPNGIACPCDGALQQFGTVDGQSLLQAKGHAFSLNALLANEPYGSHFINGSFLTAYLSPKDYHRVHMPISGTLESMTVIPGKLYSVSPRTADGIPGLFAKNERVVCIFNTALGKMAIILVGAVIVGSIHTVWAGALNTRAHLCPRTWHYNTHKEAKIHFNKGDEMGHFQLGSTVILLFEHNKMVWSKELTVAQNIQLGQRLGEACVTSF